MEEALESRLALPTERFRAATSPRSSAYGNQLVPVWESAVPFYDFISTSKAFSKLPLLLPRGVRARGFGTVRLGLRLPELELNPARRAHEL